MNIPKSVSLQKHPVGLILENPGRLSHLGFERLLNTFLYGRSEKTRRAYKQDLRDLCAYTCNDNITETLAALFSDGPGWANSVIMGFKEQLAIIEMAPASINRKLATVRSLVRMARLIGLVSWKIEVENVPNETFRDTAGPGIEAVSAVITHLQQRTDKKSVRDLAIFRLLFDLGLRRGEIAKLDMSDLSLADSKIVVLGKGRSHKAVMSLSRPTLIALAAWVEMRGNEPGPLFLNMDRAKKGLRLSDTSIYRIIRSLGTKVGKAMRPHGIRHTSITEACKSAAKANIPFEEVIQFSRHKDVRTLMVYRDREHDTQGKISALVAEAVGQKGQ